MAACWVGLYLFSIAKFIRQSIVHEWIQSAVLHRPLVAFHPEQVVTLRLQQIGAHEIIQENIVMSLNRREPLILILWEVPSK